MVAETRHRQTTSWTSFDPSPFFGNGTKSSQWPKSLMSKAAQVKNRRSVKSIGTSVTVSTSTTVSTVPDDKDVPVLQPSTTKELLSSWPCDEESSLPDLIKENYSKAKAEPIQVDASTVEALKIDAENKHNPYDDEDEEESSSFDSAEIDELVGQPRRRMSRLPRQGPNSDPCMSFAFDDLRDFAASSVNKAMVVWSQVQRLFYQQLDPDDDDQIRKRLSRKIPPRPTTVFVIPRSSNSMDKVKPLTFESLADSLTNLTLQEGDDGEILEHRTQHDDDMSSLTEPPLFHTKRPFPPMLRIRRGGIYILRPGNGKLESPAQVKYDDNGDEYIEFEPEDVEMDEPGRLFNCNLPLDGNVPKSEPSAVSEKSSSRNSEPSLADRLRTFLPQLIPSHQNPDLLPQQPAKVRLVWSAEVPRPGAAKVQSPPIVEADLGSVSC